MPIHNLGMDISNSQLGNNVHIELCCLLAKQVINYILEALKTINSEEIIALEVLKKLIM